MTSTHGWHDEIPEYDRVTLDFITGTNTLTYKITGGILCMFLGLFVARFSVYDLHRLDLMMCHSAEYQIH